MRIYYEVARGCTFCNTCGYECPAGAITMTRRGAKIDPERCTGCGRCAANCASDAIVRREVDDDTGRPVDNELSG